MRQAGMFVVALAVLATASIGIRSAVSKEESKPMLAHMVFFTLTDSSPAACEALVAGCHKHLTGHDGTVFYAAGLRGKEFDRDVNVMDYDVALQMVFKDKAAHDKYQEHPRHLKFVEEFKPKMKTIRVYDSYVTQK